MNSNYPTNWKEIAAHLKNNHNWKCERCGKEHNPATGHTLTVHHLDGNPANCQEWNLAVLCQRCHLKVQAKVRFAQLSLPGITATGKWYKPHLKGYLKNRKST